MNYIIFAIISLTSFISAQLVLFLIFNRNKIHLKGFLGLICAVFLYSLFYLFEILAPSLSWMKLFASVQYIGILSIPAFWVIMSLQYTNKGKYINKYLYTALFVLPVFLVLLNITNDHHHLFYLNYSADIINNLSIAEIEPGLGYRISMGYINVCFFIGNFFYLHFYFKGSKVYKKRSLIILATSFIPWTGYWIYMLKLIPIKIDFVPIFLAILSLVYTCAIFRSNIFETTVIARSFVFDNIAESIFVLDENNQIIDMNRKAEETFDIKSVLVFSKKIEEIFQDNPLFIKQLCNEAAVKFECEMQIKNSIRYFKCEVTPIHCRENKGKVVVLSENTEQVLLIKKLEYYGTTDLLTGVYNRNYFYKIAKEKVDFSKDSKLISIIMMDLDLFKVVNDTYGHSAGDLILKKVMRTCLATLGPEAYIGRYGGEEFILLLEGVMEDEAMQIAEGLRVQIEQLKINYNNEIIHITSSFGVYSGTDQNLESMIQFADKALYEAKKTGRNKVVSAKAIMSNSTYFKN
ncbi:histidine kinase N-terminal 7TM domain-containing diguanylate cyclase [Anaerovorax sp. IOR16]|uniref:histidine kinase N-terminal 7TM domain-containing diguanylate cyclase n=1 Tax=Anaerovorax sp. IOR16 TaxID=2773458 RepID=UPI0019D241CD|nr:histidine kinase N-terminal 7TM domain-containing protein [Anaerovorax sp. IOR16]